MSNLYAQDLEMKVVHISHVYGCNNTGGAAMAATRLHCALLQRGINSQFITVWKCEKGENVLELPKIERCCLRKWHFYLIYSIRSVLACFTPKHKKQSSNLISLCGLENILKIIKPDVIHVHWINDDTISFRQLASFNVPVVIHLHDFYLLNALKPYPEYDMRYQDGFNSENSTWYERWMFNRKKKAIRKINPSFIAPSNWSKEIAHNSIIARNCPVYVVPNVIGEEFYYNKNLRHPHARLILLYGSLGGRQNPLKGWDDIVGAIGFLSPSLRKRIEICVFGEQAGDTTMLDVDVKFLGSISGNDALRQAYHNADVFMFPSRFETQGMTKVEAMLCGLPVIAFDRSACAEGITHKQTGYRVPDGDLKGFAAAIEYYYDLFTSNSLDGLHDTIANKAREAYGVMATVDNVLSVYEEVVNHG